MPPATTSPPGAPASCTRSRRRTGCWRAASPSARSSSAEKVLRECGRSVEEVDVYVPHQANVRIIDHAARKLGIPKERVVVNVDRYGNTSSGSIPLALADAETDGLLREGSLVLMTGMGAGLTWGADGR